MGGPSIAIGGLNFRGGYGMCMSVQKMLAQAFLLVQDRGTNSLVRCQCSKTRFLRLPLDPLSVILPRGGGNAQALGSLEAD